LGRTAARRDGGPDSEPTDIEDLLWAFDDVGFPIQTDGSSKTVPGLHFMGVHFQRKRMSATLLGVAEDAEVLAERIVAPRSSG
jgi:putative flavoprotein involved in K+ transport